MLSKKLCVFPTSRAIREYIASKKDTNQLLDKTITIGDLFSNVVMIPENKHIVDSDMRIVLLQEAISKIDISSLGIDKNFSKLFSTSEYIFKFFNELSSEYKTIDELKNYDTYEFYNEHLNVLKQIYIAYEKTLEKYNYMDRIFLPSNLQINDSYVKSFSSIEIYFEGYFSAYEFEIVKEIAQRTQLFIYVTINQFNSKNSLSFDSLGLTLQSGYRYLLDITNQKILSEERILVKQINHILYPVSLRLQQIAVIKKAIADMYSKGIEADKIALVLPDESFYSYLKLFDDEKYFNFAMGMGIENQIFYKKVQTIHEYFTNDEPKYKEKVLFVNIDLEFVETHIKQNWNKQIQKDNFFFIYDYLYDFEYNDELKEKLLELKITLENLFFHKEFEVSKLYLKDAFKILIQKLSAITLDDVRSGKVTVLGILETRYASFDGVVVVDFNDDTVPKRSVKDKFLSSNIKAQVGLPSAIDRQNLQKYYYSRLFSKAKQVVISYVENEENGISRFANEIFEKPNIQRRDFSSILNNNLYRKSEEKEIIKPVDLSTLEWSASRLKTYLTCKRKFYYSVIEGLKEHHVSLEPQNFEVGQTLHGILEKCYKQNSFSYEDIKKEITLEQNKNPYLTFELELWKKRLEKFTQVEEQRLELGESVYTLEKIFKSEFEGIHITGRIDRIDKIGTAKYAILDYKTSKTLKVDSAKNYLDSNDFQLEFYYLGVRELDVEYVAYYDLYNGEILKEQVLDEKIELLKKHFKNLHTQEVSFLMCENKTICSQCAYKTLCNR